MVNKRVIYITSMKQGLPSFVYRELTELESRGIEVFVYATKYSHGLYMPSGFVYRIRPVRILLNQPLYWFRFRKTYFRLFLKALQTNSLIDFLIAADLSIALQDHHAGHIHCVEGLHSFSIGYYCKLLTGLPLSVTIYADALYIHPNPVLLQEALNACDRVVTICEFNRKILKEKYHIPDNKLVLSPVFVDAQQFQPRAAVNVLIVAQFALRKGHRVLFEAVKLLNRDDICVWVVGGKSTDTVEVDVPAIVEHLGIKDKVIFWGKVSEPALKALYEACDIFCLPSLPGIVKEGTPVALMEAMAFAKPVVTTRHAGIPEYVPEMLVEEGDAVGLAQAIDYLADHPDVRAAQGKRNREIILRKFSPENVNQLIAVFDAAG